MRLRYKLIAATLLFTFTLTVVLSLVFLSEILRERIAQTESSNVVLVHEMLSATRTALQNGLRDHPPTEIGEQALQAAIESALQNDDALADTLNGFVRYSPSIQDAYLADANGRVLVSSDPSLLNAVQPHRRDFSVVTTASLLQKRALLFGEAETLDMSLPMERNGQPFLTAHLGVRSTLLRNAYAPWLRDAAMICAFALAGALLVAAALSAAAMRPLEDISRELDVLSGTSGVQTEEEQNSDAVQRVTTSISRLDERIRTSEQTRTEMATNLNSMLQTLKDGVMLIDADLRVIMTSEAMHHFLPPGKDAELGAPLTDIFPRNTAIGALLADLLAERRSVRSQPVVLADGRTVELSFDYFPGNSPGTLLTLHDVAAQEELEREIEVARRMASIGRLTAGVGHEVKNPINAMVVHLELLRSKLASGTNADGAQRHVDVLSSEMGRLDRVVQTLADFSRPMEPTFLEQDLLPIVQAVVQLVAAEAEKANIAITIADGTPDISLRVVADAELLRQAFLNIALNAMQAMPGGGAVQIQLSRERGSAVVSIRDSGSGIPPEKLDRIFDLYFTTKPTGSGIGLALTYRIIQLHRGVIAVASDADTASPTHGTTFTLRLPLANRAAASIPAVTA
ncbi:ATP-binding protein [Terriglobus sp. TAA 43]|uniref:ATP-binding protein n=1 Tax=Terriglobus sp. TAA 43 TaxID=278961 RepID=UPI000645C6A0|nr:ATP-binding protein [Terriglobus sp. TAA 43]